MTTCFLNSFVPAFLVVLLNVTVQVVPSCTAVITERTRKRLFSCVHADMHIKLLLGQKLLITVLAGVVISALVSLLTDSQLLLVLEFSTASLTAEICFTCVRRHVVPGEYGFDDTELNHCDEKGRIHAEH